LKSARERIDIIAAYREAGTFRRATHIAETHKTVRQVIERHEAADGVLLRVSHGHNWDGVVGLVAERVEKTQGWISAKRLLPAGRAAGFGRSDRNLHWLVAEQMRVWRREHLKVGVDAEPRTYSHRHHHHLPFDRR
jgi:hypothetical protein